MPAYKHGDIINGHYTEFEQDGTMEAKGNAICWDDIYIEPADLDTATTNPPLRKLFRDDGSVGTDDAVSFLGSTGATMGAYALADASLDVSYSVELWFRPQTGGIGLIEFGGQNKATINGAGKIVTNFGGINVSTGFVNFGAWNHVIFNVDEGGVLDIFLNGVPYLGEDNVGTLNLQGTYTFAENGQVDIDLITVYDVLFSAAQALERWNGGAGTFTLPTGILDANRVLYCDCQNGAGSSILNNTKGTNASLVGVESTDYEWITGPIGLPGTLGVYLPAFEALSDQSVGFTIPIPHDYKLGSLLYPHLHLSWGATPPVAGETISFTLEYTTSAIGDAFPETQELTFTYTADGTEVPYQHAIASWDTIPGVVNSVSAEIIASLIRETDTFAQDVFFINHGTHYQINMLGSREQFTK